MPFTAGTGTVIKDSGKAILVDLDGVGKVWVPKWAIHDDSEIWEEDQEPGELVVKEKFAESEGWI